MDGRSAKPAVIYLGRIVAVLYMRPPDSSRITGNAEAILKSELGDWKFPNCLPTIRWTAAGISNDSAFSVNLNPTLTDTPVAERLHSRRSRPACSPGQDQQLRWYVVTDRCLRVRGGILNVHEITTTFANIQEVRLSSGPLQKLLGLADVEVHSAGGGSGKGSSDSHVARFEGVDNAPKSATSFWSASANTAIQDLEKKITPALRHSVREATQQHRRSLRRPKPCAQLWPRAKRFAASAPVPPRGCRHFP
jgi:hypothetical protein